MRVVRATSLQAKWVMIAYGFMKHTLLNTNLVGSNSSCYYYYYFTLLYYIFYYLLVWNIHKLFNPCQGSLILCQNLNCCSQMWSIVYSCFPCRKKVLMYEEIRTLPALLLKLCFISSPGKLRCQKCSSLSTVNQRKSVILASSSHQKFFQNKGCVTVSHIIHSSCRCILLPLSYPETIFWNSKESQHAPAFWLPVVEYPKEI